MRERISPLHDALTCLELIRLMRRERFSVVHTHSAKAGVSGRIAAKASGVPVVVHTFHALAAHQPIGSINRLRQDTLPLRGIDLHFIHEPGRGPDPIPSWPHGVDVPPV